MVTWDINSPNSISLNNCKKNMFLYLCLWKHLGTWAKYVHIFIVCNKEENDTSIKGSNGLINLSVLEENWTGK